MEIVLKCHSHMANIEINKLQTETSWAVLKLIVRRCCKDGSIELIDAMMSGQHSVDRLEEDILGTRYVRSAKGTILDEDGKQMSPDTRVENGWFRGKPKQ